MSFLVTDTQKEYFVNFPGSTFKKGSITTSIHSAPVGSAMSLIL